MRAKRLDMDVDECAWVRGAEDIAFQLRCVVMSLPQASLFIHFQVQLDKQASVELMRR